MKLEDAEISPLFSKTEIPDIFFSEYLSPFACERYSEKNISGIF